MENAILLYSRCFTTKPRTLPLPSFSPPLGPVNTTYIHSKNTFTSFVRWLTIVFVQQFSHSFIQSQWRPTNWSLTKRTISQINGVTCCVFLYLVVELYSRTVCQQSERSFSQSVSQSFKLIVKKCYSASDRCPNWFPLYIEQPVVMALCLWLDQLF